MEHGRLVYRTERCLDVTVSMALLDRAMRIANTLLQDLEARGLSVEVTEVPDGPVWGQRNRRLVTRVEVLGEWVQFALLEGRCQQHIPAEPIPKGASEVERLTFKYFHGPRTELVPNGKLSLVIRNVPHSTPRTRPPRAARVASGGGGRSLATRTTIARRGGGATLPRSH